MQLRMEMHSLSQLEWFFVSFQIVLSHIYVVRQVAFNSCTSAIHVLSLLINSS